MSIDEAFDAIIALGLEEKPFTLPDAFHSCNFIAKDMSLGDRACLGTAECRGYRVITADSAWKKVARGLEVLVIR